MFTFLDVTSVQLFERFLSRAGHVPTFSSHISLSALIYESQGLELNIFLILISFFQGDQVKSLEPREDDLPLALMNTTSIHLGYIIGGGDTCQVSKQFLNLR